MFRVIQAISTYIIWFQCIFHSTITIRITSCPSVTLDTTWVFNCFCPKSAYINLSSIEVGQELKVYRKNSWMLKEVLKRTPCDSSCSKRFKTKDSSRI